MATVGMGKRIESKPPDTKQWKQATIQQPWHGSQEETSSDECYQNACLSFD
jgi:hypothetical protein